MNNRRTLRCVGAAWPLLIRPAAAANAIAHSEPAAAANRADRRIVMGCPSAGGRFHQIEPLKQNLSRRLRQLVRLAVLCLVTFLITGCSTGAVAYAPTVPPPMRVVYEVPPAPAPPPEANKTIVAS